MTKDFVGELSSLWFMDLAIRTILRLLAWLPTIGLNSLCVQKDFLNVSFQKKLSLMMVILFMRVPMSRIGDLRTR